MGRVTAAQLGTELHDESPSRQGRLVRRLTSDHVAERLRGMIFSGALRPGERLRQNEIAAELGVSRLPVREAVQVMERDGLVVVEPHLGAFVAPFDAQVIHDHFEIVGLVQGVAARRLAERGDPELLAQLEAITAEIRAAREPARVHQLTLDFYRLINREGRVEPAAVGPARARADAAVGLLPRHRGRDRVGAQRRPAHLDGDRLG